MIHDAVKVAYSSIVGQSIMLLNDKGACIGQVGVAVGKAAALTDLAEADAPIVERE